MKLFGTAGMRGVTGSEMTPELFHAVAHAAVRQLGGPGITLAVGRDTRPGAAMLAASASAGAMEAGAHVVDAGVIPTPGLVHILTTGKMDGGMMITGSHTPPDRTGLMVMEADGAYLPDAKARELEAELDEGDGRKTVPPYGDSSHVVNPLESYRRWLMESVDLAAIRGRKFRVAVDAANGTAADFYTSLLKASWCEVFSTNDTPGPDPGRDPEPRASSLHDLIDLVRANSCDIGLAFDADADRISLVDEAGNYVSEDATGAVLGLHTIPEGGVLVCPINSSGMANWMAAERKGTLHGCRIGQPAIVGKVKEAGAHFAYEESGKYFFTGLTLGADGPLAGLKVMEILAASGEPLSAHVGRLPVFHQVKHKLEMPGDDPGGFLRKLEDEWLAWEPFSPLTRNRTDGLKLLDGDGSWLLIRPSGTEPLLRVYSDSSNEGRAAELVKTGEEFVGGVMERMGLGPMKMH